jgi:hypothetical protein
MKEKSGKKESVSKGEGRMKETGIERKAERCGAREKERK